MQENKMLYKMLDCSKNNFLFVFKEYSEEIEIIEALHSILNKKLVILFNKNSVDEINNTLITSNILIIENDDNYYDMENNLIGNLHDLLKLINVPIYYYTYNLKQFFIKDDSLCDLDLMIENKLKEKKVTGLRNIYDEKNILNNLGLKLKQIRKENNYTQESFGNLIDVSSNFLSDVERGIKSLSIEKILFLCKYFDISLDDFFLNIESNKNSSLLLGKENNKSILLNNEDRKLHTMILGQPGGGKTTLLKKYILDDIYKHQNVVVISPLEELNSIFGLHSHNSMIFDIKRYYINIFKEDVDFIFNILKEIFNIEKFADNLIIKDLIIDSLNSMKVLNYIETEKFIEILKIKRNLYEENFVDLDECLLEIYSFFENDYVKKSFSKDFKKVEFDFKSYMESNKNIFICTYHNDLIKHHQSYSTILIKICYNYLKNSKKDFKPLYIDDCSGYGNLEDMFISARKFNIGITITTHNLEILSSTVGKEVKTNVRNILIVGGLMFSSAKELSEIFKKECSELASVKRFNVLYSIIKNNSVYERGSFKFKL